MSAILYSKLLIKNLIFYSYFILVGARPVLLDFLLGIILFFKTVNICSASGC